MKSWKIIIFWSFLCIAAMGCCKNKGLGSVHIFCPCHISSMGCLDFERGGNVSSSIIACPMLLVAKHKCLNRPVWNLKGCRELYRDHGRIQCTAFLYLKDRAPCTSQQFCSMRNVATISERFVLKRANSKLPIYCASPRALLCTCERSNVLNPQSNLVKYNFSV